MNEYKKKLSHADFEVILQNYLNGQTIWSIKHPADNILIFDAGKIIQDNELSAGEISLYVDGEWTYKGKNNSLITSKITENESHSIYFNKIEKLAEDLTKEQPSINSVCLKSHSLLEIALNSGNFLVKNDPYKDENLFFTLTISSTESVTYYEPENDGWLMDVRIKLT